MTLQLYDMHTHTAYSSDSELDIETSVKRAMSLGLSGIAFTDHLDIDYTDHEDEFLCDLSSYVPSVIKLRDKYKGRLDIILGIEIGIQAHVLSETIKYVEPFYDDFDFIIGSTHLIHRLDPYYGTYFTNRTKKESYSDALETTLDNLKLYHDFDALGHFDYLVRYAPFEDSTLYYKDHADVLDCIMHFIIEHGIALELNTGTYRKVALDPDILRRYKQLGGELITIGSDAHTEDRIMTHFTETLDMVKLCGFNHTAHYVRRKPIFDKI